MSEGMEKEVERNERVVGTPPGPEEVPNLAASGGRVQEQAHLLREEERLRAPFRGDYLAGALMAFAVVLLVSALLALTNLGIIVWRVDTALGKLNALSLGIIVVVLLWTWAKDWRWLNLEERDIQRLAGDPAVQRRPEMVLTDLGARDTKPRVKTLLDDRVSRMLRARRAGEDNRAGALVQENELRAVAVWRSATLGSLARYTSGLLLLLTVFGTFLGVKAALPELQRAMAQSAAAASGNTSQQLADALGRVADAFGSNLTALVGAIAMGLVAWAVSIGRQNMLARLEHVSSLYVYPQARRRGAAEVLTGAAETIAGASLGLDAAARELGAVNSAIRDELGGVREALTGELGHLRDSVSDFSAPIAEALEQTRRTLKALLEQQAEQVAEEGRRTVDKVERQITDTTVAVQQATAIYGNMVGRLESDMRTIADSSHLLRAAIGEMQQARESFGRYADTATRTIQERLESLEASTAQHLARLEAATTLHLAALESAGTSQLDISRRTLGRYRRIDRNLTVLVGEVSRLVAAVDAAEQHRQETLAQVEERTARKVAEHVTPAIAGVEQGVNRLDATLGSLPQNLREALRESMKSGSAHSANGSGNDLDRSLREMVQLLKSREAAASRERRGWLRGLFGGGSR